jgi:hypothetical protein
MQTHSSKNSPKHQGAVESPRYMINNTPFKSIQIAQSITNKSELNETFKYDIKT